MRSRNKFGRFLLSARANYNKEWFYGTATANQTFIFAPRNATVTAIPGGFSVDPLEEINTGEKLGFETEFTDTEITLSFLPLFGAKDPPIDLRLGVYFSKWERPSTADSAFKRVSDGAPLITESSFKTTGVVLRAGKPNAELDNSIGLNAQGFLKYGFDNDIEGPIRALSTTLDDDQDLKFYGAGLDLWYTWKRAKDKDKYIGPYLKMGVAAELRKWSISSGGTYTEDVEQDILYRPYFSAGYIF
uniref:Uncharacterized protein n=1 Tax=Candidatus Kentrum sp. LFY TaxID=2126342 RepID=A0A450WLB4_9GAMM|nr:MAG: hypothetical protein BECKLFY1418C_GA0070996_10362 [Candidatus Kentron sp. LFY]